MSATAETTTSGNGHVGRALRRKEDPRLITGRGAYVDDINLVGQLWAAWVRSPEAHAKIVSIDTSAALAREGGDEVRRYYSISPRQRVAIGLTYLGLIVALVVAMDLTHLQRSIPN